MCAYTFRQRDVRVCVLFTNAPRLGIVLQGLQPCLNQIQRLKEQRWAGAAERATHKGFESRVSLRTNTDRQAESEGGGNGAIAKRGRKGGKSQEREMVDGEHREWGEGEGRNVEDERQREMWRISNSVKIIMWKFKTSQHLVDIHRLEPDWHIRYLPITDMSDIYRYWHVVWQHLFITEHNAENRRCR